MTTDNQTSTPTTVVLVDDHEFAREAVAATLDVQPDLRIVGLAGTVAAAKAVVQQAEPDIAVLDLNLPDGTGRDLVEHFAANRPDMRCVVYTSALIEGQADQLLQAGAAAVLLKSLRGTDLLDTIRRLSNHRLAANGDEASSATWPWP